MLVKISHDTVTLRAFILIPDAGLFETHAIEPHLRKSWLMKGKEGRVVVVAD
jgi:hypothetical protein